MFRRVRAPLAVVAAVVAGGIAVTLAAGGGSAEQVIVDPHGGTITPSELNRVLRAVEGVNASLPEAELQAQGERLFNSAAVAKPGESCAACHISGGGVNERLGVITHIRNPAEPIGPDNFTGPRMAPPLWDVARTAPYNWTGSSGTLEAQAATAIRTHFKDQEPTAQRVAALTAYMRTLRAPQTRQDQGRLTERELVGEEIFVGKGGCIACHGGPNFTDNQIHLVEVPQNDLPALGGPSNDPGSARIPGGFNTPQLRDVRNTAPYMHNGRFRTLEDVVNFYDQNPLTGGPLRLTPDEKAALVAYLKAL